MGSSDIELYIKCTFKKKYSVYVVVCIYGVFLYRKTMYAYYSVYKVGLDTFFNKSHKLNFHK